MDAQQHKIESRNSVQNLVCKNCHGTFLIPKLRQNRLLAEICACHASKLQTEHAVDLESQRKDSLPCSKRTFAGSSSLSARENVAPKNPFSSENYKAVLNARLELNAGKLIGQITQNKRHLDALQASLLQLEEYETACHEFEIQSQKSAFIAELELGTAQVKSDIILNRNAELQSQTAALNLKIKIIEKAQLDCYELPNGLENLPKPVQNWLKKLKTDRAESLFLYGPPGTGKTTLASYAVFYAIISGDATEALFLGSDEVMAVKKDALTVSFKARDSTQVKYQWNDIYNILLKMPLLILDDLGSQKATETTICAYTEIINARHKTALPTIYTSNHWADGGLDDKNLAEMIGERAADRVLGSSQCRIDGPSKRQTIRPEKQAAVEEIVQCEIVDLEAVKNFQTTGIAEGQTTSPFFVAHNPVFQLVSDNDRKKLTDVEGRDIVLPERRYRDTWNKGDDLSMVGYLLCQNDMMTFLALLEILHDLHRDGGRGLSFSTTISAVRKKLGIKSDSKKDTERLLRSIRRLAKTKIEYSGSNRDMFIGGFIDTVYHEAATSQSKLSISMNPAFIGFYKKLSFFKMNINAPSKLSYQARLLYVFLQSQQEEKISFPLAQLAKLYGKQESATKNVEFRRGVRSALDELKTARLQGTELRLDKNGIIFIDPANRKSDNIPQLS